MIFAWRGRDSTRWDRLLSETATARQASEGVERRFDELRRSIDERVQGVERRLNEGQRNVAENLGLIARQVWRITIRDEHVETGDGRYKQIAGGSNGLYLADSLKLRRPAVMVEGEFDALSLAQACGNFISVVATGTTQGSHTPRWIARLSRKERVLVAFDAEEKGDKAADWWLSRLENARRLRPWWKDANQMLIDGADLRLWLESGGVPLHQENPITHQSPHHKNERTSHYDRYIKHRRTPRHTCFARGSCGACSNGSRS